jgi:hypothetical protein
VRSKPDSLKRSINRTDHGPNNGCHPMRLRGQFRLGMVVHTCNPSTWKSEAGGSWIQVQPGLHSEFKGSLDSIVRSCVKKNKKRLLQNSSRSSWMVGFSIPEVGHQELFLPVVNKQYFTISPHTLADLHRWYQEKLTKNLSVQEFPQC